MNNYYIYRHRRLDTNEIFYIGLGTKQKTRVYNRAFRKDSRSDFWYRVINKTNYSVEILFESNDYEEIKELEIFLIANYGRRDLGLGSLTNLTDGGDGNTGWAMKEETKLKIGKAHSKNIGELNSRTGVPLSEEHKVAIGNANRGKKLPPKTEAQRKSISENSKGRFTKWTCKEVIDTATSRVYTSLKTACIELGFANYGTIKGYLSGSRTNKTTLLYLNFLKQKQE